MSNIMTFVPKYLPICAIQLKLDNLAFTFDKWGKPQSAKANDWLVEKKNDVYIIDDTSFKATYSPVLVNVFRNGEFVLIPVPNQWYKSAPMYVIEAKEDGAIITKEGSTQYIAGDAICYNNPDLSDGWAQPMGKVLENYDQKI